VVVGLSACATITPEQEARTKALQGEIIALLDQWLEKESKFYTDASPLIEKIRLLTSHPGWADMAAIITAYSSRLYVEGTEEARHKRDRELALWTLKWEASGEDVYSRYLGLAKESLSLEYTRTYLLVVRKDIHVRENDLILATLSSAKTVTDAKMIASVRDINEDIYERTKARLNSYRLGPLGPYENARWSEKTLVRPRGDR
jgi:hypothetical protein